MWTVLGIMIFVLAVIAFAPFAHQMYLKAKYNAALKSLDAPKKNRYLRE